MTWDEYQCRYEANELKWIADYLVQGLVFIKTKLKINDEQRICWILETLWQTLDIFDYDSSKALRNSMSNRYNKMQTGIKDLFVNGHINRDQASQILEYLRKTLFAHLQLYMTCLSLRKQETREKKVHIFSEVPQTVDFPDLETNCNEIVDHSLDANLEAGPTASEGLRDGDDMASEEEIFDPNDPLYGLDERLANLNLNEDTRQMLKIKLIEASKKIQQGLETRQAELDAKLQAMPPAKGAKR